MTARITLSIVSHRQQPLVEALLQDIVRIASPHVAAIVLTRNVAEPVQAIPATLASITTVIDNATPKGFGANHNAAFARCTTPLFAILNPDLRLTADPFADLVDSLEAPASSDHKPLALVAPRIVARDGRPEDAARKLITPLGLVRRRLFGQERSPSLAPDWLAGMFMLVRSDAFREVSGFDERYFMYCEDSDLCARLALRGWRFAVDADVEVVHDAQRASHGSWRHLRWHVTSLVRMWLSTAFWRYRRQLRSAAR